MTLSILIATLILGLSAAQHEEKVALQDEKAIATKSILPYVDPDRIDPCLQKPTPPHTLIDWDGAFLSQEWWEYVRRASNFPSRLRNVPQDGTCKKPWSPELDNRRFYWQISCPYKVYWLSRFTVKQGRCPPKTCYVLAPCWQQIRIVNCTTEYCSTRCRTSHPNVRNSVCLENNYRTYRSVFVFCTETYRRVRRKWVRVDCKSDPRACLKRMTLRLPQCCECWSCWDMYVTMPKLAPDMRG